MEPQPSPTGRSRRGIGRWPHPKECFARAGRYQLAHPDVVLVHAEVTGKGIPFVHAWCELHEEGLVFDGADNAFYATEDYRYLVRTIREVRYTVREAAERCLESGPVYAGWDADALLADYLRTSEGV